MKARAMIAAVAALSEMLAANSAMAPDQQAIEQVAESEIGGLQDIEVPAERGPDHQGRDRGNAARQAKRRRSPSILAAISVGTR